MSQSVAPHHSLTPEQRDTFERRGVLRLAQFLPAELVGAARAAVLRRLEARGLWRDGAWRLDAVPRPAWPAAGLKAAKDIGNKHPEFDALFAAPVLGAVVDDLMGGRPIDRQIYRRPQVLFTLPNIDAWMIPPGWHTDAPRLPSRRSPGVQAFALLETVATRAGGTLVVAGSHRLANEGTFLKARDLHRVLGPEPFFRQYWKTTPTAWPDDSPLPAGAVQNLPVEIMELTGAPGDVWMMDLHVLHTGAPNAGTRPRLMITNRYIAREVVREIAEGHGWV